MKTIIFAATISLISVVRIFAGNNNPIIQVTGEAVSKQCRYPVSEDTVYTINPLTGKRTVSLYLNYYEEKFEIVESDSFELSNPLGLRFVGLDSLFGVPAIGIEERIIDEQGEKQVYREIIIGPPAELD